MDLRIDFIRDVSRRRAFTRHERSGSEVESEEGSEVERRERGERRREEGGIEGFKGNGCTCMKVYSVRRSTWRSPCMLVTHDEKWHEKWHEKCVFQSSFMNNICWQKLFSLKLLNWRIDDAYANHRYVVLLLGSR